MSPHPKSTTTFLVALKSHTAAGCPKINFREIFGADRFSTFATVIPKSCLSEWPHSADSALAKFSQERAQEVGHNRKSYIVYCCRCRTINRCLRPSRRRRATMVKGPLCEGGDLAQIWWLDPCSQSQKVGGGGALDPAALQPLGTCPDGGQLPFLATKIGAGTMPGLVARSSAPRPSSELTRTKQQKLDP